MEKEPTKGAARRRTGILRTEAFLDSEALGGNFVSKSYAEFLITKGFKIEKLDDSHNVCLASQEHRIGVLGLIKLKLNITDEYGLKKEIEIEALVVPIKYDLILGLETIRDNDLTFRYPSIFSAKRRAKENYCPPCGTKAPDGTGSWPIRTLRVTAPSTETEGEIEPKERIKRSLANIELKSAEETSHPTGYISSGVEVPSHFHPIGEFKTNFSNKQAFEDDDFISEKSKSKLEAIPEEMLNKTEGDTPLPNVEHLTGDSKTRIQTLMHEFRDLFKSIVSEKGAGSH